MPLAAGFDAASRDQWMGLVEKVLGGSDFDRKLVSRTADGLSVLPLYTSEDSPAPAGMPGTAPHLRGATAAGYGDRWDIRQRHDLIDALSTEGANDAIVADLEGGVTSVLLRVHALEQVDNLAGALSGVLLDLAGVALDCGPFTPVAADRLLELWDAAGVPADARIGSLRLDPLGALARHGSLVDSLDESLRSLAHYASSLASAPHATAVCVDATPYADAGVTNAREIAISLATGVAYLRALIDEGLSVDDALDQLEFTFSATADQFATIAKLRAARRCWSRIAEASGGADGGQRQHVITSAAMFTAVDPWVNLLRASTACFAAAAGGAQAITVLPFDSAVGVPDELGRRTARNLQLLLQEESHVGQVLDPAGGSWFVERHTDQLANEAWRLFQGIEADGGMVPYLLGGHAASDAEAAFADRLSRVVTRREPITGVSEFPHVGEAHLERTSWPGNLTVTDPGTTNPALPMRRVAEPFEKLREAARAQSEAQIFLASLGPESVHTARSTFASNFFAAGGLVSLPNDGFVDGDETATAFRTSGARIAVICSSDTMYEMQINDVAPALKAAGCELLFLAGNPGENREAWQQAGVDHFIHLGCDLLAALTAAHDTLGLSA